MAEANSKKPKHEKITTPRGVLKYPRLNQPDTKFNANGIYSTKIILEGPDAAGIVAKLEPVAAKAFADAKATLEKKVEESKGEAKAKAKKALIELKLADLPVADDVDDEGEPTGRKVLNFKMNASYPDKKDKDKRIPISPNLFDAKGAATNVSVWGGTKARVAGQIVPFYNAAKGNAGVSLRLSAVQIIELVTGSGGTAESYGFGEEEGFEGNSGGAPESPAATGAPASSSASADDEF